MGRKYKNDTSPKKEKLSVTISKENLNNFKEVEIKNKSKFICWLLEQYFDRIEGGVYDFR